MAENNPRAMTSHRMLQNDQSRDDDGALDTQFEASSTIGLQMSMLENRLEAEMMKLTSMVQTTVGSLQSTITSMSEKLKRNLPKLISD